MNQTNAAKRWLTKAKTTLGPDRYGALMLHVERLAVKRGKHWISKRLCNSALIALWVEEGLPDLEALLEAQYG